MKVRCENVKDGFRCRYELGHKLGHSWWNRGGQRHYWDEEVLKDDAARTESDVVQQ